MSIFEKEMFFAQMSDPILSHQFIPALKYELPYPINFNACDFFPYISNPGQNA